LPKPAQSPRPPIIVGGKGPKRTPALAARFADEFNSPFVSPEEAGSLFQRVREAAEAVGRTTPLTFSSAVSLCVGRDDTEVARRADRIGRSVQDMRTNGDAVVGTVNEVVEQISRYAEAGASRIYLQTIDLTDLHHIELVASAVAPQLP
jgi:alkanesulfonate monooxygenase SsuD/methylene tetrahydromethanopterin reductase-like flavin-dependent oxidoreductase (luciferase family)